VSVIRRCFGSSEASRKTEETTNVASQIGFAINVSKIKYMTNGRKREVFRRNQNTRWFKYDRDDFCVNK
jgi:hypothetical protein